MGNPELRCIIVSSSLLTFILFVFILSSLTLLSIVCAIERRPKLKSRYKECVEKAIEYARTIEDFDDLLDLRTLAFHCLGPDPSTFVLRKFEIEEKKSKC